MDEERITPLDRKISEWLSVRGWEKRKTYSVGNIWYNKEFDTERIVYYNIESIPHELESLAMRLEEIYNIPYKDFINSLEVNSLEVNDDKIFGSFRLYGGVVCRNAIPLVAFAQTAESYQGLFTVTVKASLEAKNSTKQSIKLSKVQTDLSIVATAPGSYVFKVEPTALVLPVDENGFIEKGIDCTMEILNSAATPNISEEAVQELFCKYGSVEVARSALKFVNSLCKHDMSLDLQWNSKSKCSQVTLLVNQAKKFANIIKSKKLVTEELSFTGSIYALKSQKGKRKLGITIKDTEKDIMIEKCNVNLEGFGISDMVKVVVDATLEEKPTGEERICYEAKSIDLIQGFSDPIL